MKFTNTIKLRGKVPIETNWQRWCIEQRKPPMEVRDGVNYGVPCGPANGVLVLDIDDMRKFKASGRETPPTFTVKTGKGYHLYYRYPPPNGSEYRNVGNADEGYDIRGLGGQVVGPGSIHPGTGTKYEVYKDLSINDPPEWMLKESQSVPTINDVSKIEDIVVKISEKGRSGDIFNQGNNVKELIIEAGWKPVRRTGTLRDGTEVEYFTRPGKKSGVSGSVIDGRYFYSFTTDCAPFEPERTYDAFGVYTVLKHGGDFKAAAKAINGAVKAVGNDADEFREVMRKGFKDVKEARRAIEAAKEYKELREEVLPLCIGLEEVWRLEKVVQAKVKQLDGAVPPINEVRKWLNGTADGGELEELPEWAEGWVFLTKLNMFFNTKTKEMIKERAFNLAMKGFLGEDSGAASELLAGSGLMPICSNAIYIPWGPQGIFDFEGTKCVNIFKEWPPAEGEIKQEVVDIILEHAKRRFKDDWRVLIDFLAWIVQNPGKKLAWVLFIQGVQGDGKTYWSRVMTTVLGSANTKEIDPAVVQRDFTGWATGAMFGVMEEIRLAGRNRFEVMDRTKSFFTNPRISIHLKGQEPFDVPNVTNYLLLTNHLDALPLNEDDRRYAILLSSCQIKRELEDRKYFDRLYETLNERDTLLGFLEQWEVSENFSQFQAPETTTGKEMMVEYNKSDLRLAIEDFFEAYPSKKDEVKTKEIQEEIFPDQKMKRNAIGRELKKMGYDLVIEKENGKTVRIYRLRLGF